MATKLNVFNLAFAHLSEPIVTTLTDDPVAPNVAKANAQWDQALDSALGRAAWLCALESPILPLDAAPVQGWGDWRYEYRFSCPLGTLLVWNIEEGRDRPWQAGVTVDGQGAIRRVIKASWAGPLKVDVVVRRPIEALTPLLVEALALDLAARLAGPIQQNEQKAEKLMKAAKAAFADAAGTEATEIGGQEPMIGQGDLYYARLSAG